tara:strand:- start:6978 stop:7685 length:708 start_codon:yes stop_codon:yes gene_type:complete
MVGIYKITNPEGESYIGLSKNIEKRFISHKNLQFKGNNKLRESLTQYGGDSHKFEIIEEIDISNLDYRKSNSILRSRERFWINHFKTFKNGLNENKGGSGCNSHTEESKRLIGEANSKPKPKDFGKNRKKWQHTPEFREKISKANKGKTSYWKGKEGPNKGKIMSQEQKDKIGKANKNKPKPGAGRNKPLIHLNTGIIYNSVSEAAKTLNLPTAGISMCCNGKRKPTKGNTFEYL